MTYQEIPVSGSLQDHLLCFWKFIGPEKIHGGSMPHYIMPYASSSVVFFQHPASRYQGTCLTGPTKYIRETEIFAGTITFGIRFKPGLTSGIFQLSGIALRDKERRPAPELPHLDYSTILNLLQDEQNLLAYLRQQLPLTFQALAPETHPAVMQAVSLILGSKGNLKISELSERVHLSERQLQKMFKREIGLTLKEFATVMRLRDAIIQLELEQKDYQDTVFNSGYYDQAHFIRDFNKLSRIPLPAFKQYIKNIRHIDVTYRQ